MPTPMKREEHYLKLELSKLIKKDDTVFQFIQESSLDGMWYWDLENPGNEWTNPKFWTTLGYDPAQMSHRANQWQEIIFPDDLKRALENFNKHLADPNHPYDQVVRYKHFNGSTVWIRCKGMAIRDQSGKPLRMLGAHVEITQEKLNEIALKNLLRKYESILNSQSAFIIRFDTIGKIIYVNKYFQNYLKLSFNHLYNQKINNIFNEEDCNRLLQSLDKCGDNNKCIIKETLRYQHNGCTILIEWEISKIAVSDGKSFEFQGLGFDITEQKEAADSIAFQAKLLNVVGQSVIATNKEGEINYWNKAAQQLFGWTADEVLGKNILEITPSSEDKLKSMVIIDQLKSGKEWSGEIKLRKKDGAVFTAFVHDTPILNSNGELTGLIGISNDLTQQKKLQKKQDQLALVAAKTNDAVIITDTSGLTTWVNDSFTKLSGYTLDEIIGKKPGEVLQGPDSDPDTIKRMSECILNKQHCHEVILNYHKNGSAFWLDLTIDPVFDEKGSLSQFVAIEKDVTQTIQEQEKIKKNNLELQKIKQLLEQTNEVAQIGGWEYDVKTNELSWTSVTKEIFEVPAEYEPTLVNIKNFIFSSEDLTLIKKSMHRLLKTGETFDINFKIRTFKGNIRWIRSNGKAEFKKGECTRIYGVNQNVDEHKQADIKIKNIRQAIDQHTLVSITDLDGVIIDVNDIFCETTQYDKEELIGKTHQIINSGYHSREFFESMWQTLIEGRTWKGEVNNKKKDGSICWMLSTIVPFYDASGNPEQYVSIRTDITPQKQAEEEKQKTVDIISDQRNRLLDFSYIISHNIRSHASNILGIADLLNNTKNENDKLKLIQTLNISANNLDETLRHINTILKIQSNIHHKKEKINLSDLIDQVINSVNMQINELGAEITVEVPKDIHIKTDPVYLYNVLQNLISNALKYRKSNISPVIKIRANKKNGILTLSVSDNGLGIDLKKYGEKIFGMYKTFHDNPGAKGIGLFITKNQIEALGGSIEVQSEMNKGSTFTIKI